MSSMDLLVVSVFFFLSPLLSLGSSDRSHNGNFDNLKTGELVFGSTPSGLINRVDLLSESRIYLGSP